MHRLFQNSPESQGSTMQQGTSLFSSVGLVSPRQCHTPYLSYRLRMKKKKKNCRLQSYRNSFSFTTSSPRVRYRFQGVAWKGPELPTLIRSIAESNTQGVPGKITAQVDQRGLRHPHTFSYDCSHRN